MVEEFILVFEAEEFAGFEQDFLVFGLEHLFGDFYAVFVVVQF